VHLDAFVDGHPERPGPRARGRYIHYDYPVGGIQDMLTSWLPLMEVLVRLDGLAVLAPSRPLGRRPVQRYMSPRAVVGDSMQSAT
jgi:hypothetical protein